MVRKPSGFRPARGASSDGDRDADCQIVTGTQTDNRAWLRDVIRTGSLLPSGVMRQTALRCADTSCSGRLTVGRKDDPPTLVWSCGECSRRDKILSWRGTPWDLSHLREERSGRSRPHELNLGEYEVLRGLNIVDLESLRVIFAAEPLDGLAIRLHATPQELEALAECVGLEACLEDDLCRSNRLQCLYQSLQNTSTAGS